MMAHEKQDDFDMDELRRRIRETDFENNPLHELKKIA